MERLRLFVLALALGVLAYLGVRNLAAIRPLRPDARLPTFQRVDPFDPSQQRQTTFESDNDAARDALRHAVLEAANSLRVSPCDPAIKARYVDAVTRYVRAWLRIAPCVGTTTCGEGDEARLDRAQEAFGSPLDRRVHEAMTEAHQTGTIVAGDFPQETVQLVATMASDPTINPRADPAIKKAAERRRGPSICRSLSQ